MYVFKIVYHYNEDTGTLHTVYM